MVCSPRPASRALQAPGWAGPYGDGRATDGCIVAMMREPSEARLTSDAALLLS